MFTPTIKLEHADARGEIYSIALPDGHEVMLVHSTPGSLRGGHSHSCPEGILMVSGLMEYHIMHGDESNTYLMVAGNPWHHGPGVIHMGQFLEDSWLIEVKEAKKGDWTQTDYEPYREKVRASSRG